MGIAALAPIYFGFAGSTIVSLSGWGFFVAGLFGIVMARGGILEGAGMKFAMGKPLMG